MIDMQSGSVTSPFAIEAVGVAGLRYPITVRDPDTGEIQKTVADWQMDVRLPADRRGTHMSRFITELHARGAEPLDLESGLIFARRLKEVMGVDEVRIRARFTWFRLVTAPVSKRESYLEQDVEFAIRAGDLEEKILTVEVSAKALCPCSKAISDRGAHNQRSDLKAILTYPATAPSHSINYIAQLLEGSASSPIFPILKRDDEKFVTETAYDNPAFVEDIVRTGARQLALLPGVSGFVIEAFNRESIHAHDCFARIVHRG